MLSYNQYYFSIYSINIGGIKRDGSDGVKFKVKRIIKHPGYFK